MKSNTWTEVATDGTARTWVILTLHAWTKRDSVHFHLFWTADPCETLQRRDGAHFLTSAVAAADPAAMVRVDWNLRRYVVKSTRITQENSLCMHFSLSQHFLMAAMHEVVSTNKFDDLKRLSEAYWESWRFIRGSHPDDWPPPQIYRCLKAAKIK